MAIRFFINRKRESPFRSGRVPAIAAETGLPVICDFRSLDVAFGGQGAPLVPAGDRHLFPEYDYCLNLGGIANISCEENGERFAFDICPANMVLNNIASHLNIPYDPFGSLARRGKINRKLFRELGRLDYYQRRPPKSLGKEWVMSDFLPLLEQAHISYEDKLRTVTEHIAHQISVILKPDPEKKMLVTGGGAFNIFLVEKIREKCRTEIVVPGDDIVNFKEALVFAFLGVLRWWNEVNCLKSCTGASQDTCGGAVYHPARYYE